MGKYIEYGVGIADARIGIEAGRQAASSALAQLTRFNPTLAIAFIPSEVDVSRIHIGIAERLGNCPLIGTSTAGEIANASLSNTVVVMVLASPHVWVHVGMGEHVSADYRKAVHDALLQANVHDYFTQGHYLNHMLTLSAPGSPAASMLMILFTPGSTITQYSLSHEIHTLLRKGSMNRIPIFGASSADYMQFRSNYQIVNQQLASDSVAIALIESEILFGFGMAHGFRRSPKQAVITRAEGHVVYEIDSRPAAEVFSDLLDMSVADLSAIQAPLSNFPLGLHDIYGNSILLVPERLLDDGAIQFASMIRNNQIITQMTVEPEYIKASCWRAFQKALHHGGIQAPVFSLIFSCALRKNLMARVGEDETEYLKARTKVPFCGCYTFGEQGLSDDGLPVYSNQSVSALVFSDQLNPIATLIQTRKQIYSDFKAQLDTKISQIKSIKQIGKIVHASNNMSSLLPVLIGELKHLLPWADAAFYLIKDTQPDSYRIAGASNFKKFTETIQPSDLPKEDTLIWLGTEERHFGILLLKPKAPHIVPDAEDILIADIAGQLTANGCKKIDVKDRLRIKLNHIDILNQLGKEMALSMGPGARYHQIIMQIRKALDLSIAILWLFDRSLNMLIKETMDAAENVFVGEKEIEADKQIAFWQMKHGTPYFSLRDDCDENEIGIAPSFDFNFISLPIFNNNKLSGVLNFYSKTHYRWYFQKHYFTENIDFLKGVARQMSIFIENRALYQQKTLNKEIHHRVKNNLQNIASLLRMQARRLNHRDAKQALEGSISRIMSIAMVHQTLSLEDIEKVDICHLVDKISTSAVFDMGKKPSLSVKTEGQIPMLSSKFATSFSLILNELIQNAIKHGGKNGAEAEVDISIRMQGDCLHIIVHDTGPGFPAGFQLVRDSNLGLTIVSTLVKEELKGELTIVSLNGATVSMVLPLPRG
jgi:two-component sensor histidine kinase